MQEALVSKLLTDILKENIFDKFSDGSLTTTRAMHFLTALQGAYFAGGLFLSLAKGKEVRDFDLFFADITNLRAFLNLIGIPNNKINIKEDDKNSKLKVVELKELNPNAYRSNLIKISQNAVTIGKLQIILRYVGEPEEVFTSFDFEHCKVYKKLDFSSFTGFSKTIFSGSSAEAISNNRLVYTGNSRHVLCALARLIKFTKRGMETNLSTMIQLMDSCKKVNLKDPVVLKRELTGIYALTSSEVDHIVNETRTHNNQINLSKLIQLVELV